MTVGGDEIIRHTTYIGPVCLQNAEGSEAMADIVIYTRSWCSYCQAAKALLARKKVAFTEIDIEAVPGARQDMIGKANGRTSVPQIFIGGQHIGGADDLHALDRDGKLDPLLAA